MEKSETPFERKLREIEREKRRVREEIKALSRSLKRGSHATYPGKVGPTVRPSVPGSLAVGDTDGTGDEGEHDLFGWSASASAATERVNRSAASEQPAPNRKAPVQGDQRFAHYFATGGFKTPIKTRQGRTVQRNKFIFIGVVALVLIYIVLYAVWR